MRYGKGEINQGGHEMDTKSLEAQLEQKRAYYEDWSRDQLIDHAVLLSDTMHDLADRCQKLLNRMAIRLKKAGRES